MDVLILALLLVSGLLVLGGILLPFVFSSGPKEVAEKSDGNDEVQNVAAIRAPRGGIGRMRQRRRGAAGAFAAEPEIREDEVEERVDDSEDEEGEGSDGGGGRSRSRRGAKKDAKKKGKDAKRQAEEAAREARVEKVDKYADRQRQKEAAREEEEQRQAAEVAEMEARLAADAKAELDKWKDMFSVETEGTVEADVQEESHGLLQNFVDYIKEHKCVVLEDLAAEFGLRTQDVVNRVISLEEMGRISGVMDDRGKFIYIAPEEMQAVADFIAKAGRISIAQLAARSNEFIDLEPKATPVQTFADEPWAEAGADSVPGIAVA